MHYLKFIFNLLPAFVRFHIYTEDWNAATRRQPVGQRLAPRAAFHVRVGVQRDSVL